MADNQYVSKNATEAAFRRIYDERALWKRELRLTRIALAVMTLIAVAAVIVNWWTL